MAHVNDSSYLAHTQGKKHQTNLTRRAALEQKCGVRDPSTVLLTGLYRSNTTTIRKNFMKIDPLGFKITKLRNPITCQPGLFFQLHFPQIIRGDKPRYPFMSTWQQKLNLSIRGFNIWLLLRSLMRLLL